MIGTVAPHPLVAAAGGEDVAHRWEAGPACPSLQNAREAQPGIRLSGPGGGGLRDGATLRSASFRFAFLAEDILR